MGEQNEETISVRKKSGGYESQKQVASRFQQKEVMEAPAIGLPQAGQIPRASIKSKHSGVTIERPSVS